MNASRTSAELADTRPGRLRLTRRGRVVIALLVVLLAASAVAIAVTLGSTRAFASNEAEPREGASYGYIVVQPGASLWTVATELDSASDPRDVIAEIVRLNQLQGSEVQAGEALAVPLRYSDAPGVVSAHEADLSETRS
ncbi:hypothetical protein J4H92_03335 [Leucobacter weissii]|uniref:LysM domain-containing protein n=1 Tax=Leucobacter weissii TaxID=1983706 RepID=A0A939MM49_9MICO|nr:hypothetical protein [Leucobacter weissii]MBO1900981.1 hypothetical protein [Leucobacter weissii]